MLRVICIVKRFLLHSCFPFLAHLATSIFFFSFIEPIFLPPFLLFFLLSVYQWNGNNVCFCGLKCQNIWILWCQAKGNRKKYLWKFSSGWGFFSMHFAIEWLFWGLKFHSSFPFSFWFDTIKIFPFCFDYGTSLGRNNYSHRIDIW